MSKDFKATGLIIGGLFVVLVLAQLVAPPAAAKGLSSYEPLHTVVEFAAICVAIMVFAVCWATPQHSARFYLVWVGGMFLAVGIIDLAHTLSYMGMPDFITPNSPDKAIHFWLAGRLCAALGLIGVLVIPHDLAIGSLSKKLVLLLALAIVAIVNVIVLAFEGLLPTAFIPGTGLTPAKIISEYVLIAVYSLAAIILLVRNVREQMKGHNSLIAAAAIMAMSEYFFTLYGDVTDVYNLLGHVFKIIAYLFICRALFVDLIHQPYTALAESRARLSATIDAMPDLLFEMDYDGTYLENYTTDDDLLVAPRSELIGQSVFDVMPAVAAQSCLDAIHEAAVYGTSTGTRIRLNVQDGWRDFEISISQSERVVNGRRTFVVLSRDITQSVKNEVSLAHEAHLNAALLNLPKQAAQLEEPGFLSAVGAKAKLLTHSSSAMVTEIAPYDAKNPAAHFTAVQISTAGNPPESQASYPTVSDIWMAAASNGKPYIIDQSTYRTSKTVVAENEEILRAASIPVMAGDTVCLVLTVINKPEPYNSQDIETLSLLADAVWQLLVKRRQEAEIQRQREELDSFFDTSLDLLLIASDRGVISRINPTWQRTLGFGTEDMAGRELLDFVAPENRQKFDQYLQSLSRNEGDDEIEIGVLDRDGNIHCLEIRAQKTQKQIFVSGRDITDRREQEATLRRLSMAVEQSPLPVIITDLEGNISYANANFFDGYSFTLGDILGKNISAYLVHDGPTSGTYNNMWDTLHSGGNWQGELPHRRNAQDHFSARVHASPVRGTDGTIINFLFHIEDTTEKVAATARIEHLLTSDLLTGLPNLDHLEHAFEEEIRVRTKPVCLLVTNLDGFRLINETLGHHTGDMLLMELANRMRETMPPNSLLCRRSGDTFIAVINEDDEAVITKRAHELLAAISVPAKTITPSVSISASIGAAFWPRDGETLTDLITHAEAAMFQVKASGRNGFRFYSADMQNDSVLQLNRLRALRGAIANNELSLRYQPQLDLETGRIVGAEVLVRWHSPELGHVPPGEFIPLAENNGLIIPISDWIIHTAMKQISRWQRQGMIDPVFAINLSAVQFSQPDLAETVKKIADQYDVPPRSIAFELTEDMAMQNPELALHIMESLHQEGFKLAIDDFGTGYSSMNYLKQFRVDKLKIDQSFIRELEHSAEDQALTTAIVQLSKGLRLRVIAEGVESREQLEFLRQSGCSEIQGYYYSKPLTAEEFFAFLQKNTYQLENDALQA
jgi:diguanylate cyclase (GGDEF)-like protein/PAS domain S-box-containing protein